MLNPKLLALYNAAVTAHPADRKHVEEAGLAETRRHCEKVDSVATRMINAIERGETEAIRDLLGDRDFMYSPTFQKFRDEVDAEFGFRAAPPPPVIVLPPVVTAPADPPIDPSALDPFASVIDTPPAPPADEPKQPKRGRR